MYDITIVGIDVVEWLVDTLVKLPDDSRLFDLLVDRRGVAAAQPFRGAGAPAAALRQTLAHGLGPDRHAAAVRRRGSVYAGHGGNPRQALGKVVLPLA